MLGTSTIERALQRLDSAVGLLEDPGPLSAIELVRLFA